MSDLRAKLLIEIVHPLLTAVPGPKVLVACDSILDWLTSLISHHDLLQSYEVLLIESLETLGNECHAFPEPGTVAFLPAVLISDGTPGSLDLCERLLLVKRYTVIHMIVFGDLSSQRVLSLQSHTNILRTLTVCDQPISTIHPLLLNCSLTSTVASLVTLVRLVGPSKASRATDDNTTSSVRFSRHSERARVLAEQCTKLLALTDRSIIDCDLLIVDREQDMWTPCTTPWTYIGLLHDLFGLRDHYSTCTIDGIPFNLQTHQDAFLASHHYTHYKDLSQALKQTVRESVKSTSTTGTHEDMLRRIVHVPSSLAHRDNLTKSMTLVEAIHKHATFRCRVEQIELEHEMLMASVSFLSEVNAVRIKTISLLRNTALPFEDQLRLGLLFLVLFVPATNQAQLDPIFSHLQSAAALHSLPPDYVTTLHARMSYLYDKSMSQRSGFDQVQGMSKTLGKMRRALADNTKLTVPYLAQCAIQCAQGTLGVDAFPFATSTSRPAHPSPRQLIVYVVGGLTFDESASTSASHPHIHWTSTQVLNAQEWMAQEYIHGNLPSD